MNYEANKHTPHPSLRPRIDSMFARDKWVARAALATLWATLGFAYFVVPHGFLSSPVGTVLTVAVSLVLLFNTASIFAMIKHYREDCDHIYGLDIHHLDENRARRASGKQMDATRMTEVRS